MGKSDRCRNPPFGGWAKPLLGLLAVTPALASAHPGAPSSGGQASHHATPPAHAAAHASHPAAAAGFHRTPLSGHGWHGSAGTGWSGAPGWGGYGPGWILGGYSGYYAPWWWAPPADGYLLLQPGDGDAPIVEAPPAVSYRFFCPSSSAYYPDVPTCPVPWLKVVDER